MEYVYFIVLKACFIDPSIWSFCYKGFWYSRTVCYQSSHNNDVLLRPGVFFALSVSSLFTAVLISTIALDNILPVIPGNGFPVPAHSSCHGTPPFKELTISGVGIHVIFFSPVVFCQENSFLPIFLYSENVFQEPIMFHWNIFLWFGI